MRQSLNEIKNVIDKHEYTIDSIICYIMKKFNFKSICWQSGASNIKQDGYRLTEIVTMMVMFPLMLLKTVNAFYKSQYERITQMQKLGFKKLVLGYHDGKNILTLDFSIHSEKRLKGKKRKKQYKKKCIKNSNGYKRRKECTQKKNTNGLAMIKKAVKKGFMAKYVLVDTWFSSIER